MKRTPDLTCPSSVIVIGGGLAGVTTCTQLRRLGYEGEIELLESEDALYDRPPLSKDFLLGQVHSSGIALVEPGWATAQRVNLRLGTRAAALIPSEHGVEVITTAGLRLRAEVGVLALGGSPRRLPVPGADLPGVLALRTIADAQQLAARLRPGVTLAIVGAGLIGAEVASSARQLGCHVSLIDSVDPPLQEVVGPILARYLHQRHGDNGIEVVTAAVTAIEQHGDRLRVLLSAAEADAISADVVLVGIGIVADTALAKAAGLEVHTGIVVDSAYRSSHPRVFAAGDAIELSGPDGTLLPRQEHWDAAAQAGQSVAASILGAPPPQPSAPWFWTDRHGEHIEGVGQIGAGVQTVMRGILGSGPCAIFALDAVGRCVGAVSVDDSKSVRTARRLIDRRIIVDAARLADSATDIRTLLRC